MNFQRQLMQQLRKLLKGELGKARRRKSASLFVVVGLTIAVFAVDYFLEEPDAPADQPVRGPVPGVDPLAKGTAVRARVLHHLFDLADVAVFQPGVGVLKK